MKKRFWVLIIVCCLLLGGCGKVGEVETAIAAMASVTPDSGPEIQAIQFMLDELSDKQRNRVENLQLFLDNVEKYEQMCGLIDACKKAITDIGTVTLEKDGEIESARAAYDALEADNLTSYVADLYPFLEAAEKEYAALEKLLSDAQAAVSKLGEVSLGSSGFIKSARAAVNKAVNKGLTPYLKKEIAKLEECEAIFAELDAENLYTTALSNLREGKYRESQQSVQKLKTQYPKHSRTAIVDEQICQIAEELLQGAIKNKQYKEAESIARSMKGYFSEIIKKAPNFGKLQEELSKKIESIRPHTGRVFERTADSGWGELNIKANSKYDALVRVEGMLLPGGSVLFYVRKGETAKINIADGTYIISYCLIDTWYGDEDGLAKEKSDFKTMKNGFMDWVSFETKYSGNQVTYSVITGTIPE